MVDILKFSASSVTSDSLILKPISVSIVGFVSHRDSLKVGSKLNSLRKGVGSEREGPKRSDNKSTPKSERAPGDVIL